MTVLYESNSLAAAADLFASSGLYPRENLGKTCQTQPFRLALGKLTFQRRNPGL
jgi:hypothetical protein